MSIPFTYTNDSITVIHQGKPHVVPKGSPQFVNLRQALLDERWADVPNHLTVSKSLTTWAKGKVTVDENLEKFFFEGEAIPADINSRILSMAAAGKDPTPLFLFWERLKRNPSMRSVEQLYSFLKHGNIPITKDGCFLAYKGVKNDYTDGHSGTVDNRPGTVNKMSRNKVSDDPRTACHYGFHVGAYGYAGTFSQRTVICKVDPEHVVCVPYDHNGQKMRVCEYKVIGNYGELLPDDIIDEADLASDAPMQSDPADENDTAFNGDVEYDNMDEGDADEPEDEEEGDEEEEDEPEDVDIDETGEEEPKEEFDGVKATPGQKLVIPKKFKKFAELPFEELMKKQIHELRNFATHGLKIIGASKIPGGKTQLIAKIIEVRDAK